MDGVPIFSMFPSDCPQPSFSGFSGVLNSTTNVVLTEVEREFLSKTPLSAQAWDSGNRSFERPDG
jgi:homoserine dehydrogenase